MNRHFSRLTFVPSTLPFYLHLRASRHRLPRFRSRRRRRILGERRVYRKRYCSPIYVIDNAPETFFFLPSFLPSFSPLFHLFSFLSLLQNTTHRLTDRIGKFSRREEAYDATVRGEKSKRLKKKRNRRKIDDAGYGDDFRTWIIRIDRFGIGEEK